MTLHNCHSLVSGDENGEMHVWRVEYATGGGKGGKKTNSSTAWGLSEAKQLAGQDGAIVALGQFNNATEVGTYVQLDSINMAVMNCLYYSF